MKPIPPDIKRELPFNFCQEMFLVDKTLDHINIVFAHKNGGLGYYSAISKYETKPGKPVNDIGELRKMAGRLEKAYKKFNDHDKSH